MKNLTTEQENPLIKPETELQSSDEWMNGELCEPEGCEFCDMDGNFENGFHLIGCPNGMMS